MMEAGTSTDFGQGRRTLAERLGLPYMDRWLLVATLGLIAFSVFALATATQRDVPGQPLYFTFRQALYGVLGIAAMLVVARIDYTRLREARVGLYTLMIGSILIVFVFGVTARGSNSWLELPYFRFQPSELAKLLLVLSLAGFAMEMGRRRSDLVRTLRLVALGLLPAALVFLQPDLGTGTVLAAAAIAVIYLSGVPWQHLLIVLAGMLAAVAIALFAAPAVGVSILRDYQVQRLTSFVSPSNDPADAGYQVNQALISIGSGGKVGRGGEATQADLKFLPERHTDFIFAVIGERYGFLGAGLVVFLYALLVWRALRIVNQSENFYGTLVAGGIAAMLIFQIFVNVGMNLGLMPVTGVTLPLVSYGGSSVLVTFLAIGILQAIHIRSRLSLEDGAFHTPVR